MGRSCGRSGATAALAALLASGCGEGDLADPASCVLPVILSSTVRANAHNVLSAIVTVQADRADSVRIRFGISGLPRDSVTPATAVGDGAVELPVLGLLPDTEYRLEADGFGPCGRAGGPVLGFTTGSLPGDLPSYRAGGPNPSPGYVVFGAGAYGLVIDNTGRVVWYRRFPTGPGLNFQPQPNGRYTARPAPATPTAPAPWVELDRLGALTRTLDCARGLVSRFHDLIASADGSYWLMCDETRVMDLSQRGGVAQAQVQGTVIQHLSASGELLFEWSPFDHFQIEDLDPVDRAASVVNWTHGNALDLDADGNLLASFRSLSEVTKIDTRTGAVRWRMGGRANQFTFEGTAMPAWFRQHGVRSGGAGRLVLLDNLGQPAGSRAERYEYDEAGRTVRQAGSYGEQAGVTALVGGTTQQLPGGRVLVAFGNGGAVEEYDATGAVVWRIEGAAGYVFRAERIRSLYRPGVGDPR